MPATSGAPLLAAHSDPAAGRAAKLERVAAAWSLRLRSARAPLELTNAQFRLLVSVASLTSRHTSVRQSDIALYAGMDPVMTSEVLRTLESRGPIVRVPHPSDRTAKSISATDAGGALADRALRLSTVVEANILAEGLEVFGAPGNGAENGRKRIHQSMKPNTVVKWLVGATLPC